MILYVAGQPSKYTALVLHNLRVAAGHHVIPTAS